MAEAVFRFHCPSVSVSSGGIAAVSGSELSSAAKALLEKKGLQGPKASRMVTEEMIASADRIVCMTKGHRDRLAAFYPQARERIVTLGEWAGEPEKEISDPFGGGEEEYERVMRELESLIRKGIEREGWL
ncbi:MAG: low molecular weight protein arginine phosphatase [Candidatus Hydrogenedentota bacterium]|nr:MAG: low molecular weight protein arginine phosphatase [Candidatus Hydrogenedentota bacterium]